MNIAEAVEWLERGLTVKEGWPVGVCNTGEPYLTFGVGGLRSEGLHDVGADTEDLAVRYWLKHVLKYKIETTRDRKPSQFTLYWRTKPEVERMAPHQFIEALEKGYYEADWKFRVFSRFVITDSAELLKEPK